MPILPISSFSIKTAPSFPRLFGRPFSYFAYRADVTKARKGKIKGAELLQPGSLLLYP
jgi:hypothetical protein